MATLKRRRKTLPAPVNLPITVVTAVSLTPGEIINVLADNRQSLIDYIDKYNPIINDSEIYLVLERGDCKCRRIYPKREHVPHNDVICEHGNKLLIYKEQPSLNIPFNKLVYDELKKIEEL